MSPGLNKTEPGITFRKKDKGGTSLTTTVSNPKLDLESASYACWMSQAAA